MPALSASLLLFLLKATFYRLIASRIRLNCLNTLTIKNIKARKQRSNDFYWQFQNLLIFLIQFAYQSRTDLVVFAFTCVSESIALLFGDFSINSHSADDDVVMKHEMLLHSIFNSAFKASSVWQELECESNLQRKLGGKN
jgi:hypothetical protein